MLACSIFLILNMFHKKLSVTIHNSKYAGAYHLVKNVYILCFKQPPSVISIVCRCTIYKRLEEAGVPVPKYSVLYRDKDGVTS